MKKHGNLILLSADLGNDDINSTIPQTVAKNISEIKYFLVENVRTARRFLKKINKEIDINQIQFSVLDKRSTYEDVSKFLRPALKGNDIGLLSEAGNPCVADPGNIAVQIAHESDIRVIPTVGPSSILLALIASGLNGQNFAFNGYLPIEQKKRDAKIKALELHSAKENQAQIFMETPFRNNAMLKALLNVCSSKTKLCIASDLTSDSEFILTRTIKSWAKNGTPDIHKRPTIFILQA